MNQSELEAKYMKPRQARENACRQLTIGFVFISDWLKKSGARFFSQSQSVAMQNKAIAKLLSILSWKPLYYLNFSEIRTRIFLTAEKSYLDTWRYQFYLHWKEWNIKIFTLSAIFALIKCQRSLKVLVYNRNISGSYSEIFEHLRKISENDRKHSYNLRTVFGEFSIIFGRLLKTS